MKDCTELWCVITWRDDAEECDIVLCSEGLPILPIVVSRATGTLMLFRDDPRSVTVPLPDLGAQTHIAIRFDGPRGINPTRAITLEVDGKPLVSLLPSDAIEPGLLTDVTLGEAVDPDSFGIWTEQETARNVALLLDRHLAMSGLLTAQHRPTLSLHIAGWTEGIPVAVAPLDNGTTPDRTDHTQWQIDAPLPGWIWRAVRPNAETVELSVKDGGRTLDFVSVSRKDVVLIIEAMAREVAPGTASISELCALEHVVYGDLFDRLAPEAQGFVQRVAQVYGVEDFFTVSSIEERDTALAAAPVRIESEMMSRAVAEGAALARSPSPGRVDALKRILRDFGLLGDRDRIRDFLLQLTETYILANGFDDLAALAQVYGPVHLPHGVDTWTASASLPYLIRQDELDRASEAIWLLDPGRGWLVTPAIACAVSEAMAMPLSEPQKIEAVKSLVYGYMHLLKRLKSNYWGRAQCSKLLECSVGLVPQAESRPYYFRRDVERFVLEVHGLSREFWERIGRQDGQSHSLGLNTAAQYFSRIVQALERPDEGSESELIDALRHFMEYAPEDTLRFARELLTPERLGDCLSGKITGLRAKAGADFGEFIRVAAHPAFGGDASLFREELRRALLTCSDNPAHSNGPRLIARATRALFNLAQAATLDDTEALQQEMPRAIAALTNSGESSKAAELTTLLIALHLSSEKPEAAARTLSNARKLIELGSQGHGQSGRSAGVQAALTCLQTAGKLGSSYAEFVAQDPAFAGPAEEVMRSPADLVFDTMVTIISCRKYLETRKPLIASTYVARLKELGISYVYVVGGDRTHLDGDVLQLDCPDDYESLPEKVLAAVEWVHRNTRHAFMFKIDDDCFLNADEFFFGHSWRSADYYGRRIHRSIGDMDRMWHMAKSSTRRAQLELDKSPEPSIYADGGSGYMLSRRAMSAILQELRTSRGALLKNSCYMEDKLIGDLLALSGITLMSTDYHVPVFRKLPKTTIPVSMYANSFHASRVWPAKVVHLDHPGLFEVAQRQAEEDTLRPAKVWPSYASVRTGANTNALDLVTDYKKAQALLYQELAVVACMRNEMSMLPQFLAHYRRLGVKSFLISDNCSTDGSVAYLLEQPDVVVFTCDTAYRESTYGVAWQQALLSAFRCGRWSVVVDADEFMVAPGPEGRPIADFLAEVELEGADAVLALLLDMYPSGNLSDCDLTQGNPFDLASYVDRTPLLPVWFHGPYSNSPAWTSSVRHRLFPGAGPSDFTSQKTCILKYAPWMQLSAGLHYTGDCRIAEQPAVLCHFKYHAGFHAKVLEEVQRKQHFEGAAEYVKYLDAIRAGRTLYEPGVSVPWREAPMIRQALAGRMPLAWPDTRAASTAQATTLIGNPLAGQP